MVVQSAFIIYLDELLISIHSAQVPHFHIVNVMHSMPPENLQVNMNKINQINSIASAYEINKKCKFKFAIINLSFSLWDK